MRAFHHLIADYPESEKHPHAMLKIGYIHADLGRNAEAREVLSNLVARYPGSAPAGLAGKRLQRLP